MERPATDDRVVGRLTLPEELLLLGWDDDRGYNRSTQHLGALLAAALLLELDLRGHISIDDDRVHPSSGPTGEAHLERLLDELRASRRPRKVKAWIQRVSHRSWPRAAVLDRLTERGIVRRERRRFLGVVPYTRHPVVDRAVTDQLRQRVAVVLLHRGPLTDARDALLGALVTPAGGGLLRRLVPSDRRRDARRRAKELTQGEGVSRDVARVIDEINAATVVAITAGAAAASSSSSN
jgi:hypothetical protein